MLNIIMDIFKNRYLHKPQILETLIILITEYINYLDILSTESLNSFRESERLFNFSIADGVLFIAFDIMDIPIKILTKPIIIKMLQIIVPAILAARFLFLVIPIIPQIKPINKKIKPIQFTKPKKGSKPIRIKNNPNIPKIILAI